VPRYRGRKVYMRRRGLLRLRLRQLLRDRGMTGYALSKYTGLSLNTIYRLTRPHGRFQLIHADTIERLCAALRVTPTDLFGYDLPKVPGTKKPRDAEPRGAESGPG
jgi:DNA-binding Xre family transcriptional regulator